MARFKTLNHKEINGLVKHLDPLERRLYKTQIMAFTQAGFKIDDAEIGAMEVVINSVEGDESQLSPKLRAYAKKRRLI